MAAGELTALGIIASLRELRTESGAQAIILMREWLGRLENAKPALSEHRCHGILHACPPPATWHPTLACRQCCPAYCGDLMARIEMICDSTCMQSKAIRMQQWPPLILPECLRWTEAWRRLKLVREAAALDMTDVDVLGALCGALLRCQQWRLAAKYLRGTASTPLPPRAAEALVLGRARELLASAAGPASPEISQVSEHALLHVPFSPQASIAGSLRACCSDTDDVMAGPGSCLPHLPCAAPEKSDTCICQGFQP